MTDLDLPVFTAAAVQTSPVYLDSMGTAEKAAELTREASANGARLVAFPEAFVPGYPYWNWTMTPVAGSPWFERLFRASIDVPGPETELLCAVAKQVGATIVIGVNERGRQSLGTLYNTILTISSQGELIGRHRKLVPTWAEKLTWTNGDAQGLVVHPTDVGRLGVLACGENTNTLARFALLAQGEQVHIACYIALPVAPSDYDMADAIAIRTAAHCFEGKVFSVVSTSTISPEIMDAIAGSDADLRAQLGRPRNALSGIYGPDGRPLVPPLIDDEGIVYAEIDLNRSIQAKQMHDIVGHYNRFDIFTLHVDRSSREPSIEPAAHDPESTERT